MSDPRSRTLALAAGLLVAGGLAIFFSPDRVMITVQWTVAGLAAIAALHLVVAGAPSAWWTSPFDRADRPARTTEPVDETHWIRTRFEGRRVPVGGGRWALPPETVRLLRPLIEEAMIRKTADAGDPSSTEALRGRLAPLTRAVLATDSTIQPGWWGTTRSDGEAVARLVDRVLDDLERLEGAAPPGQTSHEPTERDASP